MCSVSVCKCARVLVLVLSLKLKEQDGENAEDVSFTHCDLNAASSCVSSRCSCSLCVDVFSVASDWLDSNEITAKTCTLMCVCVCVLQCHCQCGKFEFLTGVQKLSWTHQLS